MERMRDVISNKYDSIDIIMYGISMRSDLMTHDYDSGAWKWYKTKQTMRDDTSVSVSKKKCDDNNRLATLDYFHCGIV